MSDVRATERASGRERCAFCHEDFVATAAVEGDVRVFCERCGTPHHRDCLEENGGCSSLGCENASPLSTGRRERRPPERAHMPIREGLSTLLMVLGGMLVAFGVVLGVLAQKKGNETADLFVMAGASLFLGAGATFIFFRTLGRRPPESEQPAPFTLPAVPPQDAIEATRRLNIAVSRRASGTLPEPAGPGGVCPSCAQPLEAIADLASCYHCGAAL